MTAPNPDDGLDLGLIDPGEVGAWESRGTTTNHVWVDGRCTYCNMSELDFGMYTERACVEHPLTVFRSETPR